MKLSGQKPLPDVLIPSSIDYGLVTEMSTTSLRQDQEKSALKSELSKTKMRLIHMQSMAEFNTQPAPPQPKPLIESVEQALRTKLHEKQVESLTAEIK